MRRAEFNKSLTHKFLIGLEPFFVSKAAHAPQGYDATFIWIYVNGAGATFDYDLIVEACEQDTIDASNGTLYSELLDEPDPYGMFYCRLYRDPQKTDPIGSNFIQPHSEHGVLLRINYQ